jgi:DNA-binding response OmpR family regulator
MIRAMNVLLVISNRQTAGRFKRALERAGYVVVKPDPAHDVLDAMLRRTFDLLIVDAGMYSDGAASSLYRRLRAADVQTPRIVVSATGSAEEAGRSLDAGADDVVLRTVAIRELLARIRALLRRGDVWRANDGLQAGDLRLDVSLHAAVRGTEAVALSVKEFQLLEILLRQQGKVVPRQQIRMALWPEDRDYSNVVDLYVHYLRQKLDRDGQPTIIRTIRGVGYIIDP